MKAKSIIALIMGLLGIATPSVSGADKVESFRVERKEVRGGLGTTKTNERDLQCSMPRQLLKSGQSISENDEVFTSDYYAFIKQEPNGRFVVKRTNDDNVLCESVVGESSLSLHYVTTKLQSDGHLVTRGSYDEQNNVSPIWRSQAVGPPNSSYFLAVNCDDSVSIYQNSVFGSILWTCADYMTRNFSPQGTPSPTPVPTPLPTPAPPTESSTPADPITTFCVVADAPYRYEESIKLLNHIENMDSDCEFVVHLGDIRSARQFDTCVEETYRNVSLIMKRSQKPVLMVLGDNEWNDCPNHQDALAFWHDEFDNFPNEHWSHNFNIDSQPDRVENMYFVHKKALFITLNIVGGRVVNQTEWDDRLTSNFEWTKSLIESHVRGAQADANVVVIMAHATNTNSHWRFFHAMRDYIDYDLNNNIPILYLNGDVHSWNEQYDYFEQWNWKRITVTGNAREKPLKVTIDARDHVRTVDEAFSHIRYY